MRRVFQSSLKSLYRQYIPRQQRTQMRRVWDTVFPPSIQTAPLPIQSGPVAESPLLSLAYAEAATRPIAELAETLPIKPAKSLYYYEAYDELFSAWRDTPLNILELGIYHGGSILLWASYFTQARIMGIDINPPPQPLIDSLKAMNLGERVRLATGSQADPAFLDEAISAFFGAGQIDVIIDDASHFYTPTRVGFAHLFFKHLRRGGMFIIEDWESGYWPKWHDGNPDGQHGLPRLVKELVDLTALHARTAEFEGVRAYPIDRQVQSPIRRMTVQDGLVIVTKA